MSPALRSSSILGNGDVSAPSREKNFVAGCGRAARTKRSTSPALRPCPCRAGLRGRWQHGRRHMRGHVGEGLCQTLEPRRWPRRPLRYLPHACLWAPAKTSRATWANQSGSSGEAWPRRRCNDRAQNREQRLRGYRRTCARTTTGIGARVIGLHHPGAQPRGGLRTQADRSRTPRVAFRRTTYTYAVGCARRIPKQHQPPTSLRFIPALPSPIRFAKSPGRAPTPEKDLLSDRNRPSAIPEARPASKPASAGRGCR